MLETDTGWAITTVGSLIKNSAQLTYTDYNGITLASGGSKDSIPNVTINEQLAVSYTDDIDNSDQTGTSVLIDPYGVIFDSATGEMLNGFSVRLVNATTGQDAVVYGDDGVSIYDSTIISGGIASDSSGATYDFPDGNYRFPFIAPGDYYLEITPPPYYIIPSDKENSLFEKLPNGPFVVDIGSRGEKFTLIAGPPLHLDIPADPYTSPLYVRRTASKEEVSKGDFIQFRVSVENISTAMDMSEAVLTDLLPQGFAYKTGSARIDGVYTTDPEISSDGRLLTFRIGTLAKASTYNISYVAAIGGSKAGIAESNSVGEANGGAVKSNNSLLRTKVKEAFMGDRNILMGRVIAYGEDGSPTEEGLPGVRIYMENGTFTVTDKKGRYHFEGVTPGTHVIQLDIDTLPKTYEAILFEKNTRFAGRAWSKFIDLQGGTLWRTDFHAILKPKLTGNDANRRTKLVNKGVRSEPLKIDTIVKKPGEATIQKQFIIDETVDNKIVYNEEWLSTAAPGIEWMSPKKNDLPSIPNVTVAIKHGANSRIKLLLNGKSVADLNFDGTVMNVVGTALSRWTGVDLVKGGNILVAVIETKEGREEKRLIRKVHFSGPPVQAEFVKEESILKSDGITQPVITIRLTDKDGYPARRGNIGGYKLNAPYQPVLKNGKFDTSLLPGSPEQRFTYKVGQGGLVKIKLKPVATGGKVKVTLPLTSGDKIITAHLFAPDRDWIIVGFAEGTVGYNRLNGKKEDLTRQTVEKDIYKDGKIAFFARGRLQGKWLLTMAYDNKKENTNQAKSLFNIIDPGSYYTVYGDASKQGYDAASRKKLYLKLENEKFNLLFGDYNTDFSGAKLASYNRALTGVKSEYHNDGLDIVVFSSESNQAFIRDEFRGNMTGPYKLSRQNIVMNSEHIIVETRNRFRSENILESRKLSRHTDYDIDYQEGIISLREPVFQNNINLNHNFIVIKYESYDKDDFSLNYGGRIKKTVNNKITVGVTHLNEGRLGGKVQLTGADTAYQVNINTIVRAELAQSKDANDTKQNSGRAFIAEVEHRADNWDSKVYFNQTDQGFGLGQTNGSENGTRKIGVDGAYRPVKNLNLTGSGYKNLNIEANAVRKVVEVKGNLKVEQNRFSLGARSVNDKLGNGKESRSNHIIAGAGRSMLEGKFNINIEREQAISSDESVDFPTVIRVGADYRITEKTFIFAEREWSKNNQRETELTKLGVKTKPWNGGNVFTGIKRSKDDISKTISTDLSLTQKWKLNEKWSMDFGAEKSDTMSSVSVSPFNSNVPFSHGSSSDYTAGSIGATYNPINWIWNARIETRNAANKESWSAATSAQTNPREEIGVLTSFKIFDSKNAAGAHRSNSDLRIDLAYRPISSPWIVLNKLELKEETDEGGKFDYENWRIVNTINSNYYAIDRWQFSLQHGIKYIKETIDKVDYNGVINLYGAEARYDVNKRWDIGTQISALHSIVNAQADYSAGISVGHSFIKNVWLSLGYNAFGFYDRDFSDGSSTAKGFYLKFRVKFDKQTASQAKKLLQW